MCTVPLPVGRGWGWGEGGGWGVCVKALLVQIHQYLNSDLAVQPIKVISPLSYAIIRDKPFY